MYGNQGAFDSFEHEHLPRTKYDTIVDESSNKPGEQAFEVSSSQFDQRSNTHRTPLSSFLLSSQRGSETYLWPLFGRDSQIGHMWTHRRWCSVPRSEHIQTGGCVLFRHCLLVIDGKVRHCFYEHFRLDRGSCPRWYFSETNQIIGY